MSRMVSRNLSVADLCLIEVGGADSFLRFAVAIPIILSRRAESTQITDVLLLSFLKLFYRLRRVFQVSQALVAHTTRFSLCRTLGQTGRSQFPKLRQNKNGLKD